MNALGDVIELLALKIKERASQIGAEQDRRFRPDAYDLPTSTGKKLPRYPTVQAVRMGRLAVNQEFKGKGLGGALLADALSRAARSEIAAYALVVDAKDEKASTFYRHHGFIALPDAPLTLFLPLATTSSR